MGNLNHGLMGENRKAIHVPHSHFPLFHFLYIHPLSFVQVWNPQKTRADWHLFGRVHSGGAGVMHQAHPKLSRLTNSLSLTPAEISLPMSLQMDHILNECVLACVCVCIGIVYCDKATHLHVTWSLILPFSDPALPLFISLTKQRSSSLPFHTDAPVTHIHANGKTSKPLTPDSLCQSPIATFTHCDNPLSVKSANCHSVSDGIRCHTPALACHTPSVCQRVTPQWPDFQSSLSVCLSPSCLFGLPVHQLPV